ncbi:hypothetical protein G7068_03340 [Leucobacter viscericola]|uniref:Scaffolding protein n=1 Tax=Leucobacter viscericola TaxID=2714935 RepID=A0A6G7XD30_9MICO|nr:hypothetical protein [Leucobacter viscericola]QIK62349.1 hypothetical protein G7068_03340 [Leucobacter viscericola]
MTEQTNPAAGTEVNNEQNPKPKEFQAITSQEDFDKAIQGRIAREQAKFANYDELKAAADKLAEIEESQKTEAQKQQDALTASQARVAELEAAQLRVTVAEEKSDPTKGIVVPAALLTGTTREELEASADKLIAFKGEAAPKQRLVIPKEGTTPSNKSEPVSPGLGTLRAAYSESAN